MRSKPHVQRGSVVKLPADYARCQDGKGCPFARVCARRTTIATDDNERLYSYAAFYTMALADHPNPELHFSCEHKIVDPDA